MIENKAYWCISFTNTGTNKE